MELAELDLHCNIAELRSLFIGTACLLPFLYHETAHLDRFVNDEC